MAGPRATPRPVGRGWAQSAPTTRVQHLGYDKYDLVGRYGVRTKTVLTEPWALSRSMCHGTGRYVHPVVVAKRQRRLGGVDTIMLSLVAEGG